MHPNGTAEFIYALSGNDWLYAIFLVTAVVVLGNGVHFLVFRLLRKEQAAAKRRNLGLRRYIALPARAVFLAIGLLIILPAIPKIPQEIRAEIQQVMESLLVLLLGWLAVGAVYVFQAFTLGNFDTSVPDNLRARRVHTQMQFIRRILIFIVLLLDGGALLWSLHNEVLWKYGTGLLASAGLASLVLAGAAKATASNLLAGLQIALSEPIRIDDVVVIQGEWGRIEEITTTYVVVKIWDLRRLVVPLSYFIEQPFQNWTRTTGDIMGTAFLYVDYSVPVEPLRAVLRNVVSQSPLWDGRVCGLQVTNLTERSMELRCLVSSRGSAENFDLRCLVREKMVEYLQANYPSALPTLRVEMRSLAGEAAQLGKIAALDDQPVS